MQYMSAWSAHSGCDWSKVPPISDGLTNQRSACILAALFWGIVGRHLAGEGNDVRASEQGVFLHADGRLQVGHLEPQDVHVGNAKRCSHRSPLLEVKGHLGARHAEQGPEESLSEKRPVFLLFGIFQFHCSCPENCGKTNVWDEIHLLMLTHQLGVTQLKPIIYFLITQDKDEH